MPDKHWAFLASRRGFWTWVRLLTPQFLFAMTFVEPGPGVLSYYSIVALWYILVFLLFILFNRYFTVFYDKACCLFISLLFSCAYLHFLMSQPLYLPYISIPLLGPPLPQTQFGIWLSFYYLYNCINISLCSICYAHYAMFACFMHKYFIIMVAYSHFPLSLSDNCNNFFNYEKYRDTILTQILWVSDPTRGMHFQEATV